MASQKQEPNEGLPPGGGGNSAGPSQTQHTQGGGLGAEGEVGGQEGGPGGHEIPESLKVGPPGGVKSTNPFMKAHHTGNPPASGPENVANPWDGEEEKDGHVASASDVNVSGPGVPDSIAPNANAPDASAPSESSQHQGSNVTDQFQNLNISDNNTNPWKGPVEQESTVKENQQPPHAQPVPSTFGKEDSGNEAWSSAKPPPLINVDDTHESSNQNDNQQDLSWNPAGEQAVTQDVETLWEETPGKSSMQETVPAPGAAPQDGLVHEGGGSEPTGAGEQQSGVIDSAGHETSSQRPVPSRPPNLPPRNTGGPEDARTSHDEYRPGVASPSRQEGDSEQKIKETYDIRKAAWFDVRTRENPRISPILIQRSNGPCPLLALVNALTISTPPDMITPLFETLRTREQVSLELLLNAVIEELMSKRFGDGTQELPDLTELYKFLITLHTGMNVNPSYFPPAATNLADDPRRSMSHVHPSEREEMIPGTFEQTPEMKLYSTFLVPIIHGWLPEPRSDAQAALARSARTYEDAQHILFCKDDLEMKFISDGLDPDEQMALDDIMTIDSFLDVSRTQLTNSGLETMRKALAPGSVSILFRNDHFSTLYKHPQSGELMQLVTDLGLVGHDEIVWESLPDINGENCRFYSGDFRPVGGDAQSQQASGNGGNRQSASVEPTVDATSPSAGHQRVASSTEQEDHDLALALQLQEEEDQRHEEETARRRRESGLNQQQQGGTPARNTGSNDIPVSRFDGAGSGPRGGNGRGSAQSQALAQSPPPQRSNPSSEEALPSYEHAATQPRFDPPLDHPAHPGVSPEVAQRRQQAGGQSQRVRPAQGRPPAQPVGGAGNRRQFPTGRGRDKDRDCCVM
ncbi:hypothetical protein V496_08345 [Pseudogymnoascus sp. VKM F-4515 (FW-2607)]|nr:hypothetical protein V496_08345 [Pseudogymnoascus sp. VKM F-4515 (FW-2607)]KFY94834.1 hypothetical protein V498_03705 [Pseudogymnoascus sp. VKM F-4517 (FW-2822)]